MNNYHLFLIRSDQVTQILTHLAAGVLTLVLISSLESASGEHPAPAVTAQASTMTATLPEGTEMLAVAE